MTLEQQNFITDLTDKVKLHDEWLSIVRLGMGTLLNDQDVLIEIIVREAAREAAKFQMKEHVAADHAASIMNELGLKFALME